LLSASVIVFHKDATVCSVSTKSGSLKVLNLDLLHLLLVAVKDFNFLIICIEYNHKMSLKFTCLLVLEGIYP
jgi:hypothetical protein